MSQDRTSEIYVDTLLFLEECHIGHEQDLTLSGSYLIMKNCINDERDYGGYHAKGRKWLGTSGRGERGGS
ncbi:hypothetical protein GJ496_011703 [Pomphorhynchus laevis]|nr:hypothetical protein GJ496_011703 [Pomphorhynchus laevis]